MLIRVASVIESAYHLSVIAPRPTALSCPVVKSLAGCLLALAPALERGVTPGEADLDDAPDVRTDLEDELP